jgi:epoxyqueuosine reductase
MESICKTDLRARLRNLFSWSEEEFLKNTEGSAIRRTGYEGWLRNLAIGLGNIDFEARVTGETLSSESVVEALKSRIGYSTLVDHHIEWAISQHQQFITPS